MNDYEAKKQARIDRYCEKAEQARSESSRLHQEFRDRASAVPFGQPNINSQMVRYRQKTANKLDQAVRASEKADYYEQKAEAAENNTAISADDPDAIEKLKAKLEKLKYTQERMKKINAYYRKHQTCRGCEGVSAEFAAELDEKMATAYSWETAPYPSYALSNNNQEIRRIEKRIQQLTQAREVGFTGWTFDGGKVVANAELNRLQIFFDEIPAPEVRKELKGRGFRWARSEGAWQRQLTNNAIYEASRVAAIRPTDGTDPRMLQPGRKAKDGPER